MGKPKPENILITYASRTGSTEGIANAIADTLIKQGAEVAILPMRKGIDLSQYQVVIAGSAIQNRQWLPEAVEFIRSNQAELNQKTTALFTVCMTLAMKNGEKYRKDVAEWVGPVKSMVKPVDDEIFAGTLDISKIPSITDRLKFRLSVLFSVWKEGDHRDWEAIGKWADGLHSILQPQS